MKKFMVYTNRTENIGGCIYIFIQLYLLPFVLHYINSMLTVPFSDGVLNFIYFAINFICVTAIFHRFLLESLRVSFKGIFTSLKYALLGFLIYQIGQYAISFAVMLLYPNFTNLNDTALMDSVAQNYTLMSIGVILLTPVAEEALYRGVVFGAIHKKSPVLAYIVSTIIFSLIHIIGYDFSGQPITLLISFLSYLPAGLCLAWSYNMSGTIITPILIHIAVNQLGILYMR